MKPDYYDAPPTREYLAEDIHDVVTLLENVRLIIDRTVQNEQRSVLLERLNRALAILEPPVKPLTGHSDIPF